ncbi:hypothetical protein ACS0TY_023944 [Phlomoides rotata]
MTNPNTISTQESSSLPALGEREPQQTATDINASSHSHVETNEQDDEVNPLSAKKRQKTSKVWDDFNEITLSNGIVKVECIHCKTQLTINKSVQNFKYDQAKMREVISHMIIIRELPFSFVEYKLFNFVMKTATPHY